MELDAPTVFDRLTCSLLAEKAEDRASACHHLGRWRLGLGTVRLGLAFAFGRLGVGLRILLRQPTRLLPLAARVIDSALAKLPGDAELGELLINTALHILKKAVALTSTKVDDDLYAIVEKALANREE